MIYYINSELQDLPATPESAYIIREKFNKDICDKLIKVNQSSSGGRILVHGMAGSGKTIAVCQSVRHAIIQQNCFRSHGCIWTKIGISPKQNFFIYTILFILTSFFVKSFIFKLIIYVHLSLLRS